jgi:hypothetical protein
MIDGYTVRGVFKKYRTFGSQKYIYSYRTNLLYLLQSSPLGNAHTYPRGPAIVGNASGTHILEWCSAGSLRSA